VHAKGGRIVSKEKNLFVNISKETSLFGKSPTQQRRIYSLSSFSAEWSEGMEKMAGMFKTAEALNDAAVGEGMQHLVKTQRLVQTKHVFVNR